MINPEQQKVPLGGNRVPDSMGGGTCDWEKLPIQNASPSQDTFPSVAAVMAFRKEWGNLKKALTDLAPPVKDFIFALESTKGDEACEVVKNAKEAIESACIKISECGSLCKNFAATSASTLESDELLSENLSKSISSINRSLDLIDDVVNGSNDLAKASVSTAIQQIKSSQQNVAKEVYGDFSLKLQVFTRKAFGEQGKLLEVIKIIKKDKTSSQTSDAQPIN